MHNAENYSYIKLSPIQDEGLHKMELKAAIEEAMQFKCSSSAAFEYWAASEPKKEKKSLSHIYGIP